MLIMSDDDVLTEPVVRRIEVFTGAGRRRKWSAEAKAQIVAESYATSVGEAADRHGLAKTQLFTWRREVRTKAIVGSGTPRFAPVVVAPAPTRAPLRSRSVGRRRRRSGDGGIELDIGGVALRVERGADAKTVAAVIRALKAAS